MKASLLVAACAACLSTAPAFAQDSAAPDSSASERRLTPEQVEAVLAEAAAKRSATAELSIEDFDAPPLPPQIHGEVGFGIGTGGYREAYGSAIYPLGNYGSAAISLNFIDWGHRRYGH